MQNLARFVLEHPNEPLPFERPRRRKPQTPWVHGSKEITQKHLDWLRNFIKTALRNGETPCIPEILQKLRVTFELKLNTWTLRCLFEELNFRYGKLQVVRSLNDETDDELNQIRLFIMKLDYLHAQTGGAGERGAGVHG